jgi:hypothetical protein
MIPTVDLVSCEPSTKCSVSTPSMSESKSDKILSHCCWHAAMISSVSPRCIAASARTQSVHSKPNPKLLAVLLKNINRHFHYSSLQRSLTRPPPRQQLAYRRVTRPRHGRQRHAGWEQSTHSRVARPRRSPRSSTSSWLAQTWL